jgi:hypothetical protein
MKSALERKNEDTGQRLMEFKALANQNGPRIELDLTRGDVVAAQD